LTLTFNLESQKLMVWRAGFVLP